MAMEKKSLPILIRNISHPDPGKRRSAAEALSSGDERAIYPLIKALRDDNPGVQDAAMRSLISIGGELTAYMILPLLREEAFFRNTAIIILREIGTASVPLLKPLLKDKDDDIRKFAADLICEIKECGYPEELARMIMDDPSANVRASAARAVGILQYRDALPQLIQALKDEEWVCFSVLETLSMFNDGSVIEAVISLLDSPSAAIRYAATEALGRIGSPALRNALLDQFQKTEGIEKRAIVKSLVQIGLDPSMSIVSDVLIDMLKDGDWEEKFVALKGIAVLKEERAVQSIVDVAGSFDQSAPGDEEKLLFIKDILRNFQCCTALIDTLDNPNIRYRGKTFAIEVLGDLRCRRAVPSIIRMLKSNIRDIRRAAASAIQEVCDRDMEPRLAEIMDDEDGHVRREAVSALGRIGDKRSFPPIMRLLSVEQYNDVIEEAVKALLGIDSKGLLAHMNGLSEYAKEVVCKYSDDAGVLLRLSCHQNARIKAAALLGLGRLGAEGTREACAGAMHDPDAAVRKAAVIALGELKCCEKEIKSALKDADAWVRLHAIRVLGNSGDKGMMMAIEPMLLDREIPVVLSAADALMHLGGEEAIAMLGMLRDHEAPAVRARIRQLCDGAPLRAIEVPRLQ